MAKRVLLATLTAPLALMGCHSSDEDLSSDPPKNIEQVTTGGFRAPMDAVANLDGTEFYFTAIDDLSQPALFKTAARAGASAEVMAAGDPLESQIGLVLSCDGETLYAADVGGMAKVSGSRMAMPFAPPSPGSTPMITPSVTPMNINSRLNGVSATENP